jgi:hypothetical protein
MRRVVLAGALVAFATWASAQGVVQPTLSGNETWQAGQGPGGPSSYITSNLVRNSTTNILTTVTGSVTLSSPINFGGNVIISAQPSAATITLPANPIPDGAIVGICNGTGSAFATNAVTLAANTGQTLAQTVTLTTLGAGTCARVQFHLANTHWYRIQ